MDNILWKPSAEYKASSNMMHFIEYVNQIYDTSFSDYSSLYHWSINHKELFWSAIVKFCDVKFSVPAKKIYEDSEHMIATKWFTGAKMNFAENLLMHSTSNKNALVFNNEKNQRQAVTWDELHSKVAKLANALKNAGVDVNDRIVAVMPNMPETIMAMLATTSLGCIWSSCSPDFGIEAIIERFGQIQPKILFITDGHLYNGKAHSADEKIKQLEAQLPSLEKIVLIPYLNPDIKPSTTKCILWKKFLANHSEKLEFVQLPFDHPVYIMFSSGTTGLPKCIVHGAGGTLLQHLKELVLHTNLSSADNIFYYTTCGWMMWNWYISSLACGATLIQYDGSPFFPHKTQMFDLIDAEKITVFGTSAKFISACEKYNLQPKKTHGLKSLKAILSTGSPLVPKNFEYVYQQIKKDVCLSSISGGTDIISCFALGNPLLPVYSGELQCIGLGMNVEVFNEQGESVVKEKGELVCTAPFPSMPIYFWNDPDNQKYFKAYFNKFPNVWTHGDFAEITKHHGLIIYGRSDATLNSSGIRIGTAEIYRQVEKFPEILDSVVVAQNWEDDVRIILFIKLANNDKLDESLKDRIRSLIRKNSSPHHVPAKIIQVDDIPKTMSGKTVELAIREAIHNRPIKNLSALANPEALQYFKNIPELSEK